MTARTAQQFKAKPVFDSLPALSGFAEEKAILRDAVEGSRMLKEAVNEALARFAAAKRITPEEAATALLGNASRNVQRLHFSAADYTGHRPTEIVARPIGEIIQPIVVRVMEGSRG